MSKKTSIAQFIREIRLEAKKVAWPTKNETIVSTVMVGIMAVIAAFFFLSVDAGLSRIINFIFKIF